MDSASPRYHRALGVLGLLGSAFWGALAVYAVHASLPTNPIAGLPLEAVLAPQRWLPQTYGFFSRAPQYKRSATRASSAISRRPLDVDFDSGSDFDSWSGSGSRSA